MPMRYVKAKVETCPDETWREVRTASVSLSPPLTGYEKR